MSGAIYHDLAGFGRINSSPFEVGIAFHVAEPTTIDGLQWYRAATGAGIAPEIVRLWRVSDTSELGRLSPVPDDGAVGWQHGVLATPIDIVAGQVYIVAGYFPGAGGQPSTADPGTLTPSLTIALETSHRRYKVGSAGFPVNADAGSFIAMDVTGTATGTGGGGGDPLTLANLSDGLAEWLSSDGTVQLHETDGLPWLTKLETAIIRAVVGSTPGQLDATKAVADSIHDLLTAENKNLGTLWDLAGHLADLEIAAWQHFFGAGEARLTGPDASGGSAFYTPDGQLVAQLVAETWQRVRVLRNDLPFGVSPWTMTAESDFEDAIAFAEPADAYTLHITSYQPTQPATESPAGLWLPRIGWWCVLTGAHASQRQFIDFEQQLLSSQGERMAGCAIQLKPGTLATVQAWLLA